MWLRKSKAVNEDGSELMLEMWTDPVWRGHREEMAGVRVHASQVLEPPPRWLILSLGHKKPNTAQWDHFQILSNQPEFSFCAAEWSMLKMCASL